MGEIKTAPLRIIYVHKLLFLINDHSSIYICKLNGVSEHNTVTLSSLTFFYLDTLSVFPGTVQYQTRISSSDPS